MIRSLRQAAWLILLGTCLACIVSPRPARSQESQPAGKQEKSEPAHELLFKTINFIILVGGLGYVLRKPLADFFSSRSAAIQKELAEGRKALEASQTQLHAVEEKLSKLQEEIASLRSSAACEMEAERRRLEQNSADEAARILESARTQMAAALRGAKLELKNYAAQKAVAFAEELIRSRLDDAGRHKLVAKFVATLDSEERKN